MLKTRTFAFCNYYSAKRRKPPLEGLFFKNSKKNGEGANENLPFFIWSNLAYAYNKEQSRAEQSRAEQS